MKVKVKLPPCVQLRDRMDYSPPGSSIHGIFQARILEWVLPDPGIKPEMEEEMYPVTMAS